MKPNLVIYHSADFDGIFCREIANRFLKDQADYIGWNHGDEPVDASFYDTVFILDLPPKAVADWRGLVDSGAIIWIDHHASSIASCPASIPGYRIDGVAACRLTWQWFNLQHRGDGINMPDLPEKQAYIDRKVSEPQAVRLAGEYDVWDSRDPDAESLQYGLRTIEPNFGRLLDNDFFYINGVISMGRIAQQYAQNQNAEIANSFTWIMEWEGLQWLCVNHARFNSLLFAAKDVPETGHDALLGFRTDGKKWMVSLYHANHRKDLDLSEIAKRFGGGGHRGACGFTCKDLPFNVTESRAALKKEEK